jgi:hypothetical protein
VQRSEDALHPVAQLREKGAQWLDRRLRASMLEHGHVHMEDIGQVEDRGDVGAIFTLRLRACACACALFVYIALS